MRALRVGVTPRAFADIERIATWWRKNRRAAPQLFQGELDVACINIAAHPEIGHKAGLRAYPGGPDVPAPAIRVRRHLQRG